MPEDEHHLGLRPSRSGLPSGAPEAERVAEVLRAATGAARLRAGQTYDIAEVAHRMGVTANSLRAALPVSQSEGIVTTVTTAGFTVADRSTDDLRELVRLRVPIETASIRKAASSELSELEVAQLRTLSRATRDAAQKQDFLAYINADMAFHLALISLADSPEIVEIVRVLRSRSQLHALDKHDWSTFMDVNVDEHDEMVEQVQLSHATAASDILRAHITRASALWTPPSK